MEQVRIVTDSCASLPDGMAEELGIKVVPYYIHRDQETLRDLVDISREEFLAWLDKTQVLPKTANPGPGDYLGAFEELAAHTRQIVTIHMTSLGSGAYQSAMTAKQMAAESLPHLQIEVIDTLQVAMSHGWAVIEAARTALAGASIEKVVQVAKDVAARGTMIQTADTLKYLYMGGRIGRAKHLVATALNIKPLIGMQEGVIVALGQARSRQKAYQAMARMVEEKVGSGGAIKIAFMHVGAPQEAEKLRQLVEPQFDCREVLVSELSSALAVHTGRGTVGLSFYPV